MTPQQKIRFQEMQEQQRRIAEELRVKAPCITPRVAHFIAGFYESDSNLSGIKGECLQDVFGRFVFSQAAVMDIVLHIGKQKGFTANDYYDVAQMAICSALTEHNRPSFIVNAIDVRRGIDWLEAMRDSEDERQQYDKSQEARA